MKFLALITLLIGFNVNAETINATKTKHDISFIVDSWVNFGNVYYNCDVVEYRTETILEALGATNVDVDCDGGLDDYGWSREAFVTAEFESLVANESGNTQGTYEEVRISEYRNCHLDKEIFEGVKKSFSLKDVKYDRSCFSADSRSRISAKVLK